MYLHVCMGTIVYFFGRELAFAYPKVGTFYLTSAIVVPFMDGVIKSGREHK